MEAPVSNFDVLLGTEWLDNDPDHARVRVPMRGFVESLNVSVTAAILLHAATHGRAGDLEHEAKRRLYGRGLYLSVPHAEDVLAGE